MFSEWSVLTKVPPCPFKVRVVFRVRSSKVRYPWFLPIWHTQPKSLSQTFSSWSCLRSTDHIFMLWFSLTLTRDTLRYYGDIMEIEMGKGSFTHASSLPIWYTQPHMIYPTSKSPNTFSSLSDPWIIFPFYEFLLPLPLPLPMVKR